jgi:tRNA ligase
MAIVVRLHDEGDRWQCVNRVAHITVGTRDNSVKPKESNQLLTTWLEEGCTDGNGMKEVMFDVRATIQGEVIPVLSR